MKKKRHTPEQIIVKLNEADVYLSKGLAVVDICKKLGISEQTYYRWRSQYRMKADEIRRLKELAHENHRLKKVIAEQALEISLLKEMAEKVVTK